MFGISKLKSQVHRLEYVVNEIERRIKPNWFYSNDAPDVFKKKIDWLEGIISKNQQEIHSLMLENGLLMSKLEQFDGILGELIDKLGYEILDEPENETKYLKKKEK